MKRFLIIPDIKNIGSSLQLAEEYSLGFEYNNFYDPSVLDNETLLDEIIGEYKTHPLPDLATSHGAFFDVIPFSLDARIREISVMRIEQSISVAEKIGARAVVFHTNYNPFLNSPVYVQGWIEQNAKFWSEVLENNPNISIYLENMFDTSPDIIRELSERLSAYENYGVCLDYAHAALSDVPPHVWAECLGKYVKHVHINDNDLKSDLHLPWGSGLIDKKLFYDSYEKHMRDATVLIETAGTDNQRISIERFKKDGFI